jgi:hypothetical protein
MDIVKQYQKGGIRNNSGDASTTSVNSVTLGLEKGNVNLSASTQPPDFSRFILVDGRQYFLKSIGKPRNYRFIESFDPSFGIGLDSDIEDGSFLISNKKHDVPNSSGGSTQIDGFFGIEEERVILGETGDEEGYKQNTLSYPQKEGIDLLLKYVETGSSIDAETISELDIDVDVRTQAIEIQISITNQPTSAESDIQNSTVEPELISYDQLTSMSSISQESFAISTTTSFSGNTRIDSESEIITDVGGLSTGGRDRTITNTGGGNTYIDEDGNETSLDSTSVRTSGY